MIRLALAAAVAVVALGGGPTHAADPAQEIKELLLSRCAAWGQSRAREVWGPGVTPPPRTSQQNADAIGFDCYAGQARAANWLADRVDMGTISRTKLEACIDQERRRPLGQPAEATSTFGRINQCADPHAPR